MPVDEPEERDEPEDPPELPEPLELEEPDAPLAGVDGDAAGVLFEEPLPSPELDPVPVLDSELPPPSPEEPPLFAEEPALP